jgi:hypothetical protein
MPLITTSTVPKVVALIAAVLLLPACSGSSQPASTPTTHPRNSPIKSRVAHSVAAPLTVAAARQRAAQYLALYSAGQWAAAYEYIAPGLDKNISKEIWVGVHDACTNPSAGQTYLVSHGLQPVGLVDFSVSPAGAASALGTKQIYMTYSGGQWYYDPSNGWIYFGHSLSHAIAKAKGQGLCSS